MTDYTPPVNDMRFILNEVFNVPQLWQELPSIADTIEPDTADAILQEAAKITAQILHPLNQLGDELGCQWQDGRVSTPEGFKAAYKAYCDGGWNGLGGDPEYGGMGMPKTLTSCVEEMLQGSGLAFGLAPMLTAGACLAIKSHASDALKKTYLPNMYAGIWSGAMDLTEPHCGTDLGLLRTKATPNDDGSYQLSGTKIFITWGEHDMSENIIHLVLAKLPDAPAGSRGISLFLVPKVLVNDDGSLGERNGVHCGSLEHKMGIHGSATCVMNYDNAKGWLVGEPNKGLAAMFTMMNDERLAVGVQGVGVAELAYQQASRYARERLQGRNPAGSESPEQPADSLLVHGDVRRMLLSIRACNEGARAFLTYVAQWLDREKFSGDSQVREHAQGMVALLTPIAKAFITDKSFEAAVSAQQVLGGHGYIREWGVEQLVRDARIAQIYEGTNGIQAMDLLGRKIVGSQGKLLTLFIDDVTAFIQAQASDSVLSNHLTLLQQAVGELTRVSEELIARAQEDPHLIGAVATHYLHYFGYTAYLYMWLRMMATTLTPTGSDADFYRVKYAVGEFFIQHLWPQTQGLLASIRAGSETVSALKNSDF